MSFITKNMSQRNIWNNKGPNIDPWRTLLMVFFPVLNDYQKIQEFQFIVKLKNGGIHSVNVYHLTVFNFVFH